MLFSINHVYRSKLAAAILGAVVLMFSAAPRAFAQEVAVAEVDGHVTDPSGASIGGATVKMTEANKGVVHTFTTDPQGVFRFPNLPVGPYTLDVTAPGFKAYHQSGIVLQVGLNIDQPVSMQVGAVTETVDVVANASMVETKENSIAQVMDQQRIVELPLNG
ncbi:MAG TPA: carboxypeptidase-like regulatory domain-containing protein, partial [Candidatus Sulfopaludibacter sp.]|nr:carboxypeptidase-like regulatory domain-containing protein [Candidatus Sulfopaludibacter sp.]